MTTINENELFSIVVKGSLLLLVVSAIAAYLFFSDKTAVSILVGGTIAILNFFWMRNVLQRILGLQPENPGSYAQMRFLARITVTGLALYAIIASGWFSVIGLVTGLSVIVINIIVLSIYCALRTGG